MKKRCKLIYLIATSLFLSSIQIINPLVVSAVETTIAYPSTQSVQINGNIMPLSIYSINENNYFKLQDIAYYMDCSFTWNEIDNSIIIKTNTPSEKQFLQARTKNEKTVIEGNQKVYIDGQLTDMNYYIIDGNSYFKIRDLAQALDFSIIFNPEKNQIQINKLYHYAPNNRLGEAKPFKKTIILDNLEQTKENETPIVPTPGFSGEFSDTKLILSLQDPAAKEDYSQKANPKIFELTSADAFNAAHQSYLDRKEIVKRINGPYVAPEGIRSVNEYYRYAHFTDENNTEKKLDYALSRINYYYQFSIWHPSNTIEDKSFKIIRASFGDLKEHQIEADAIAPIISKANQASNDREKVKILCQAVIDKLEYSMVPDSYSNSVFTVDGIKKGLCEDYTLSFQLLCTAADIPCIDLVGPTINGDSHAWNEVYINGEWYVIDVSACDVAGTIDNCQYFLDSNYTYATDSSPDIVLLAKEILVPGSTK